MNLLRAILLVAVAAALTLFAVLNDRHIPVDLGFVELNIWLPLLVLLAFIVGFLPMWLWLVTDRMIARRRITRLEAALGDSENQLAQARVELLRPPVAINPVPAPASMPAPPPGI